MHEIEGYEVHPYAEALPLIEGQEFQELIDSIATIGQCEPIIRWRGKILDGRNRLRACLALGIEPKIRDMDDLTDDEALDLVVVKNLHRRHLNASQRALVAERLATFRVGSNIRHGVIGEITETTQIEAAAQLKVSPRYVNMARYVRENARPHIVAMVDAGHLSLTEANYLAKLPAHRQDELRTPEQAHTMANELRGRSGRLAKKRPRAVLKAGLTAFADLRQRGTAAEVILSLPRADRERFRDEIAAAHEYLGELLVALGPREAEARRRWGT